MGIVRRQKYDLDNISQDADQPQVKFVIRRKMTSCTNCLFVSGSITLTAAVILVGIAFFAPYWLSNLAAAAGEELKYTHPQGSTYLSIGNVSALPDRGLWAQCGTECQWFWEYDYELQQRLLTPLKWPLATQVLFFVGAVLLLTAEIFARVQLCCDERKSVYWSLALIVLASGVIQLAGVATFGAGATRAPYNAVSDPTKTTPLLGRQYDPQSDVGVFLGWAYWMAVVGDMLTVMAGTFFVITAFCVHRKL